MAIRPRQLKNGVSWEIDYRDPNGKRVRQSFKKKEQAAKALERVGLGLTSSETPYPSVDRILNSMFCHDPKSRHINATFRMAILKRDRERCVKCGRTGRETLLEVDHIIPVSEGGRTVAENLQTLCEQCNGGKLNIFAG